MNLFASFQKAKSGGTVPNEHFKDTIFFHYIDTKSGFYHVLIDLYIHFQLYLMNMDMKALFAFHCYFTTLNREQIQIVVWYRSNMYFYIMF